MSFTTAVRSAQMAHPVSMYASTHTVRRIFNVCALDVRSILQENCCTYTKLAIGRIRQIFRSDRVLNQRVFVLVHQLPMDHRGTKLHMACASSEYGSPNHPTQTRPGLCACLTPVAWRDAHRGRHDAWRKALRRSSAAHTPPSFPHVGRQYIVVST